VNNVGPRSADHHRGGPNRRNQPGSISENRAAVSEQNANRPSKELLLPTDVEGFDSLAELALDMRWTWNHATDQVWGSWIPCCGELTG